LGLAGCTGLFAHGDPVNGVDPSGQNFTLANLLVVLAVVLVVAVLIIVVVRSDAFRRLRLYNQMMRVQFENSIGVSP